MTIGTHSSVAKSVACRREAYSALMEALDKDSCRDLKTDLRTSANGKYDRKPKPRVLDERRPPTKQIPTAATMIVCAPAELRRASRQACWSPLAFSREPPGIAQESSALQPLCRQASATRSLEALLRRARPQVLVGVATGTYTAPEGLFSPPMCALTITTPAAVEVHRRATHGRCTVCHCNRFRSGWWCRRA